MNKRFNKANVLALLERHTAELEAKHKFKRHDGTDQVFRSTDAERVREYGAFDMLLQLTEAIEGGDL